MEAAKQKTSTKTKATKGKTVKVTVAKTKRTKAKKSSEVVTKTAAGKSKKSKVSFKSETKNTMSGYDLLCKHTQSTELTSKNTAAISSAFQSDILSDTGREPGQSPDSQETISDDMLSPETNVTRISKNLHPDDLHASKGVSEVQDLLVSGHYLESSESDYHSSESEYINSPTKLKISPQTVQSRKRSGSFSDSDNDGSSEKN